MYRSNLPRPFNKNKGTNTKGDRKVISSTTMNGKIVQQQVVYHMKGYSITKHERT